MKKSNKQLLFERMHTIGGMPLKEFANVETKTKFPNLTNFIGNYSGYYVYFHTTNTEQNAKSICDNGFQFIDFNKTTDYITNVSDMDYYISMRKQYGNFIVVFQINSNIKNYESISKKEINADDEDVFVLPPQYVKGYYDKAINKIFANPLFRK